MGVGRIYSIQGGGGQKGEGIFSKFRGELAERGVKKFRGGGVWTLDEAMPWTPPPPRSGKIDSTK